MRISLDHQRDVNPFRLLESLEPRTLLSGDPYSIVSTTSFPAGGRGGAAPQGLIMAPNATDVFYGTTISGGTHYGTVFKITGTEHTYTKVAVFNGKNGIEARGGLVVDNDGNLYGTAVGGGAKADGVVWEISHADLTRTPGTDNTPAPLATISIVSFHGTDGAFPISGLYANTTNDAFFGYTLGAGASKTVKALVFQVTPGSGTSTGSGNSFTVAPVAGGTFTHGERPSGGLAIDPSGNIFGETRNGGTNHRGRVFEIANNSNTMSTYANFTVHDGAAPDSDLFLATDGTLYGTTLAGGTFGAGTVFKVDNAGSLTTLASLKGSNGVRPIGSLIVDSGGNVFGVAAGGGGGGGTLFEASPSTASATYTISVLAHFNKVRTGRTPTGPLITDGSGNFFATTFTGGTGNLGTVDELSPNAT